MVMSSKLSNINHVEANSFPNPADNSSFIFSNSVCVLLKA